MSPSLRVVSERFPNVRDQVVRIFEHDEDFRDLCQEYEACVETVSRLQTCTASSHAMRNEYGALLLRLELELLRYLEEHANNDSSKAPDHGSKH